MASIKAAICMFCASTLLSGAAIAQNFTSPLMDGRPWSVTLPDGRAIAMTFMPNGVVAASAGYGTSAMRWVRKGNVLCISGAPSFGAAAMHPVPRPGPKIRPGPGPKIRPGPGPKIAPSVQQRQCLSLQVYGTGYAGYTEQGHMVLFNR
ncbi:hypothetical protein [uncultured Tateyamaria sp.]|uniref:hypothetical protein n=1 Tax=uncultured Tateyamaria sp. TaxID=455651 RepID=UPI002633B40A|nr:hypothetical protein [uncultured Tateyamaria sp.]